MAHRQRTRRSWLTSWMYHDLSARRRCTKLEAVQIVSDKLISLHINAQASVKFFSSSWSVFLGVSGTTALYRTVEDRYREFLITKDTQSEAHHG
jgi:hypothetical protein